MKEMVLDAIDTRLPELIAMAKRIHANPELGFQERQASGWLTGMLEESGFTVKRGVADLETAFRAEARGKGGGPTVAFVAEYDALPDLGHACGHNLIGTAAVAAGIGLAAAVSAVGGTVAVVGTPAEEGGGGKVLMVDRGAFEGVDVAMMFHPAGYTLPFRPSLASYRLTIRFHGRSAHAAAAPDEGINALDAMIQTFVAIGLLRQQLRDDARIAGIIARGGAAANIIPDLTEAQFSVRGRDQGYAGEVLAKVVACARGAAEATGCRMEHEVRKGYEAMKPNAALAETFSRHLQAMGMPVDPPPDRPRMGSTDMGNVSQRLPSLHAYVAIGPRTLVGHTNEFRDAANTDRAYQAMAAATKAMALTGLDLLTNPDLLAVVTRDFAENG
ncbi:MAG: M20 family metallopeptidase [Armatimonadetes bacterium]|nr:M20 family metallopeptidase [Armatimonadota bacterium]